MRPTGNKPGEMRHVDHQVSADLVGDFAKPAEIDHTRIRGSTSHDHLRAVLASEACDLVHIDAVAVATDVVGDRVEPLAGDVELHAVRQVAAGSKIEPEKCVPWVHQRHERRGIGGRAGMRLHVGEPRSKQSTGALDREPLGDVDILAAAIIAPPRIAFGIFVGQHRPLRFQHRLADDVLGRDQLDLVALAAELVRDGVKNFGIGLRKRVREKILARPRRLPGHCHFGLLANADFMPR